jgi:glucose-6-phosphate 1-epimerase
MDLSYLNQRFGIRDQLSFAEGQGGLPVMKIDNPYATADIYLHGGHVTHFQPHGTEPILWLSKQAQFAPAGAIRGGIPLIWPWFGAHPTDDDKPAHGFARRQAWQVRHTIFADSGATQVELVLHDNEETKALWPHPFRLSLTITVGPALRLDLSLRHMGTELAVISNALHSYFFVSDITQVDITGLEDTRFVDKLDKDQLKLQQGSVVIEEEVDRVYLNTTADCVLHDPGFQRRIRIAKAGSHSTVVWNPWAAKAKRMADFPDEGYRHMVCIETANALHNTLEILPHTEARLTAVIGHEPL